MLKHLFSIAAFATFCYASPIVTLGGNAVAGEGQYSSRVGATTVTFNGGAPSSGVLVYSVNSTNLVTGSLSGQYAAPSGDSSQYLTVGPSAGNNITIQASYLLSYFGFYASSVDDYNVIRFYRDADLVLTLNGTTLATLGGFTPNGQISTFVNIEASSSAEHFNRIVLSSSSNAFETDNHAFGAAIPEPATFGLVGSVLVGIALFRARRNAR